MAQVLRDLDDIGAYLLLAALLSALAWPMLTRRHRDKGAGWRSAMITSSPDVMAVSSVLMVLSLTLQPRYWGGGRSVQLTPLADITGVIASGYSAQWATVQLLGNVLIFIPIGFLLPWRFEVFDGFGRILPFAAALATFIELFQFIVPLGRTVSVDDAILNVAGAVLGYAILRLIARARTIVGQSAT